jgi:hypothetical protein
MAEFLKGALNKIPNIEQGSDIAKLMSQVTTGTGPVPDIAKLPSQIPTGTGPVPDIAKLPSQIPGSGTPAKREIKNAIIQEYCSIVRGAQHEIRETFLKDIRQFLSENFKGDNIVPKTHDMIQDVILNEIQSSLLDNYFVQHQMVIILYQAVGNSVVNSYVNDNAQNMHSLDTLSSSGITDDLLKKLREKMTQKGGAPPSPSMVGGDDDKIAKNTAELLHFFPREGDATVMNTKLGYVIEKGFMNALKDTMEGDEIQGLIKTKIEEKLQAYMTQILGMFGKSGKDQAILQSMMLYTLLNKGVIRRRFRSAIDEAIEATKRKINEKTQGVPTVLTREINEQVRIFFSGKHRGGKLSDVDVIGRHLDALQGGKRKTRKTKRSARRKRKTAHKRKSKRL